MTIQSIETVYTVEGTEKEVRELKQLLLEKYGTVDVYPTPYNYRLFCKK